MKNLKQTILYLGVFILLCTFKVQAQFITAPSKGKSVIYFVQNTNYLTPKFNYFCNNKFIGTFEGENYLRYEFDPGKALFWVTGENTDYLEANTKEGEVYIIEVIGREGFVIPKVSLVPIIHSEKITFDDYVSKDKLKVFNALRTLTVLKNKTAVSFSSKQLQDAQLEKQATIAKNLKLILSKRKKNPTKKLLSSNQSYSSSKLLAYLKKYNNWLLIDSATAAAEFSNCLKNQTTSAIEDIKTTNKKYKNLPALFETQKTLLNKHLNNDEQKINEYLTQKLNDKKYDSINHLIYTNRMASMAYYFKNSSSSSSALRRCNDYRYYISINMKADYDENVKLKMIMDSIEEELSLNKNLKKGAAQSNTNITESKK